MSDAPAPRHTGDPRTSSRIVGGVAVAIAVIGGAIAWSFATRAPAKLPGPVASTTAHRTPRSAFSTARDAAPALHTASAEAAPQTGTSHLHGRITTTNGAPLPGAAVVLRRWDEPLAEAVADQDGRFDAIVDPGPIDVEASAPGFASRERAAFAPEPDDVSIDLRLPRLAKIIGRVVRDDTGEGLPHATVTAEAASTGHVQSVETETDDTGEFHFDALESSAFALSAEAPGLYVAGAHTLVLPGETSSGIVLRAKRAAAVRGRLDVASRTGAIRPCADGEVTFSSAVWPAREVSVDEAGRWEIPALPAGRYEVHVGCTGSVHSQQLDPVTVASTDRELILLAKERSAFHGTLRSSDGEPLPGLMVLAHPNPPTRPATADSTHTDREGAFTLRDLAPGAYTVFVARFEAATKRDVQVLPEGTASVDLVLDLRLFRGRLVDREGHPIRKAMVELCGVMPKEEGQLIEHTDEQGRFTMTYALPANGAPDATLAVDLAGQPLVVDGGDRVRLPARDEATFVVDAVSGVLAVDVVDAAGRPAENAEVEARCEGYFASETADGAGHVELWNVPPAQPCALTAKNVAGESGERTGARVGRRNVISLRPPAILRGVLDNQAAPFSIDYGGSDAGSRMFPGPGGAWELRVPPGDYTLTVNTDALRGQISTHVDASQTRVLVIPLHPREPDDDEP